MPARSFPIVRAKHLRSSFPSLWSLKLSCEVLKNIEDYEVNLCKGEQLYLQPGTGLVVRLYRRLLFVGVCTHKPDLLTESQALFNRQQRSVHYQKWAEKTCLLALTAVVGGSGL